MAGPCRRRWPDAGKPITLRLRADEICPADEWHAALATARDAAIAGSDCDDPAKITSARDLITLANHLHVRSWKP
jgi:hypothetical protein